MATTVIKSSPTNGPDPSSRSAMSRAFRAIDAVYRFLASLKLAVVSLSTLAAVLAYATFFESWYGAAAVQQWIYMSTGFALLLAFLGANILCAALIRFPWKKRQTGFVVTHAGLLTLLAGSWYSLQHADEGQLGMLEGDVSSKLVRVDHPVVRIRELDAHTRQPVRESTIPFQPGSFAWDQGTPRPRWLVTRLFHKATLGLFDAPQREDHSEVLSSPGDPFQLIAKVHLPASMPKKVRVAAPDGAPMAKIHAHFKAPGKAEHSEIFDDESGGPWFKLEKRLYRNAKNVNPALFAFTYADRPEMVEDFLSPPQGTGPEGAARFRYRDKTGAERKFDWPLDGQAGKSITLADSDLTVTFVKLAQIPTRSRADQNLYEMLGEPFIPVAHFQVRKGEGSEEVAHYGWASLPMVPNVITTDETKAGAPKSALLRVDVFIPPDLDAKTSGRFGQVEVMGTPDGSSYYRVFGRGKEGKSEIRSSGRVKPGEEIIAFGGVPNMPMTITFEVEEYLPSGVEKDVCIPMVLPQGKMGEGIPATLVEMTVDGHKEEFWIRRSASLDPIYQPVTFPGGAYEIAYDTDRKDLGFQLKLDDFEVGFDPGTEKASSFASQVRLTDEAMGIRDKPVTISMNEPLTHRQWTFYQSRYERVLDPRTRDESGQFKSVFQVGSDAGRGIKMLGCILIVAGAFFQFYMRAGIFTDGGKRERARAAARANPGGATAAAPEPETDDPL